MQNIFWPPMPYNIVEKATVIIICSAMALWKALVNYLLEIDKNSQLQLCSVATGQAAI